MIGSWQGLMVLAIFRNCAHSERPYASNLNVENQFANTIKVRVNLTIWVTIYAQCGKEKEALETITLAQNHFPSYPEHDPSFLYADCSLSVLYQWEGKMYLHLTDHHASQAHYQKAWNAFTEARKIQTLHQRGISEVTIDQANTARGMGELSVFTSHLREGIEMAVTLKSQRRYQEAVAVYLQTPDTWLAEREIVTLAKDVFGGQLPRKG